MPEWIEQLLTDKQRQTNLAFLLVSDLAGTNRDSWGPGPSHDSPILNNQWFDRQTGRCWVYQSTVEAANG